MSSKRAKLKLYGLVLFGVIATLHIGSLFIKPLVDPTNKEEKAKADAEYFERMKRI